MAFVGETQFIASNSIQFAQRYDGWLKAGETIVSASATPVNYVLATIDRVVIEPPFYNFFTYYLTGGSAGDVFQVNLQVTTSLGQIRNDYMRVVVGPNGEAYTYSASLLGPTGPTGTAGTNGAGGATGPTGPSVGTTWSFNNIASPPVVSAWTQHNFAASTSAVDFTEGLTGIRLKTLAPSSAAYNFRGLVKAAPSTPYDLVGRFRRQHPIPIGNGGSVHHVCGVALYESSSGKSLLFGLGNNQASNVSLVRFSMSNDSTLATNFEVWGSAGASDVPWEWYVKVHNDGVHLTFYYSYDGNYWNLVDSGLALTAPFTSAPNNVGFGFVDGWWTVNSDNPAQEIVLDCGGWTCS